MQLSIEGDVNTSCRYALISSQPGSSGTMANDRPLKVLTDTKYGQGAVVTRNLRSCQHHCGLLLLLVATLSALLHSCEAQTNLTTDAQALLAFKKFADLDGVLTSWKASTNSCTNWTGIECNDRTRVSKVWLNNSGLSGTFAENTLSQLDQLRYLIVANNQFQGPIPDDIGKLTGLIQLWAENAQFSGVFPNFLHNNKLMEMDLSGNNLSGQIPDLSNLSSLFLLNLSSNSFSGIIPPLPPNIETLDMSYNSLTGRIPSSLPSTLTSLDLSYNQLSGQIPSNIDARFPNSSYFAGNEALCGTPTSNACPPAQPPGMNLNSTISTAVVPSAPSHVKHEKHLSAFAVIGIVVANAVGLALIGYAAYKTVIFVRFREEKKVDENAKAAAATELPAKTKPSVTGSARAGGGGGGILEADRADLIFVEDSPHRFELEDLLRASAEILGKGSMGTTYRARLESGNMVVVKRLKEVREMEMIEFEKQMTVCSRMRHPNLLPLRAYYYAEEEKLLVYDFMFNGSLASILHDHRDDSGQKLFDWDARLKVAHGVALGLSFLHEKCPPQIFPHQNVKSSNVLLGNNYEAYLADYCLVPLMPPKMAAKGMTGYAAPEYNRSRRKSQKVDVYSFGVLLLELLTGRRPAHSSDGKGTDLPKFVKGAMREEWTVEVFDLQLKTSRDGDAEMVTVLQMAMRCVENNPDHRPPLTQVVKVLESMRRRREDESFDDSRSMVDYSKELKDYDTQSQDNRSDSASFSR